MKIDLLGGSYQQKYKEFNSQRTINWYQVVSTPEEKSKSQTALFPFAGLTMFCNLSGRYNRGIFTARTRTQDRCFTVVDQTLYEIDVNNKITNRGTMSALAYGSTRVWMCVDSNDEVGIFHYSASYVFNMDTNTLTQITSNQFPGNVTYADYLDGYTVVVSPNNNFGITSSVFYAPSNNMLTGWLSTQTFSPTFKPSKVKASIAFREEIYNLTETTIEIYYNDGTSPYSRLPRSTLMVGLAATESVCITNDGFYFLGRTQQGEPTVFFFDSLYNCVPISPSSINWALSQANSNLSDSTAMIQSTKDGHVFYYLTVPAINTTFVYDTSTKQWQERQSINPVNDSDGTMNSNYFRCRYHTNFRGLNLFTDTLSGAVFVEDFNKQTENGTTILRTRISETFANEYMNIAVASLEFDCNTGSAPLTVTNPSLMINYSRDSGYNYCPTRTVSLGLTGNHLFRARMFKLGTGRNWTVKITLSDAVDLEINNAIAHGTMSNN